MSNVIQPDKNDCLASIIYHMYIITNVSDIINKADTVVYIISCPIKWTTFYFPSTIFTIDRSFVDAIQQL